MPVLVSLIRLAVPLWVFNFGIAILGDEKSLPVTLLFLKDYTLIDQRMEEVSWGSGLPEKVDRVLVICDG